MAVPKRPAIFSLFEGKQRRTSSGGEGRFLQEGVEQWKEGILQSGNKV